MTKVGHPWARAVWWNRYLRLGRSLESPRAIWGNARQRAKVCGRIWKQAGCTSVCRLPKTHDSPHGWFICEESL